MWYEWSGTWHDTWLTQCVALRADHQCVVSVVRSTLVGGNRSGVIRGTSLITAIGQQRWAICWKCPFSSSPENYLYSFFLVVKYSYYIQSIYFSKIIVLVYRCCWSLLEWMRLLEAKWIFILRICFLLYLISSWLVINSITQNLDRWRREEVRIY